MGKNKNGKQEQKLEEVPELDEDEEFYDYSAEEGSDGYPGLADMLGGEDNWANAAVAGQPDPWSVHKTAQQNAGGSQWGHANANHWGSTIPTPAQLAAHNTAAAAAASGSKGGKQGKRQGNHQQQQKGDKKGGGKGAAPSQQAWETWRMDLRPQAAAEAWGNDGDWGVSMAEPSSSSVTSTPTVLQPVEKEWIDSLKMPKNFITWVFSLLLQPPQGHIIQIRFMVQQWMRWDVLESLASYHSIVKLLFGTVKEAMNFSRLQDSLERTNHALAEEIFQCLSQDLCDLQDQLVAIFRDSESYKSFLACRGDVAQLLLDLLQDLLDSLPESSARPRLSKALERLSRASGLHPTCFPLLTGLVKVGHQIAAGGFGDIWKGLLGGQKVSVKIMRLFRDADIKDALQDFGHEALIWRQLSHPNLLPFFGLYYLENRLCLVSPWMSNGHIIEFLKNAPPDTDRVSLMLDVALGVKYLHENHIVHGDLKGMNVLVTPSCRACVADFGLASIAEAVTLRFTHSTASPTGGTARYQAPELLSTGIPNHFGSDVYAFGSVCYEILTGKAPFFEMSRDITVIIRVLEGLRPSRPVTVPVDDDLWQLLQDCWQATPADRPNISQIIQRLVSPIGAKSADAVADWDESISSKSRRSLQEWPLLPSITAIERRIFGNDVGKTYTKWFQEAPRSPSPPTVPEIQPAKPGWRTVIQRSAKPRKARKQDAPPPPPGSNPRRNVRSWATWMPDPNRAPTPPSLEPTLRVLDPASPGLFGPRSPRDNRYSATLRKSSSPPGIRQPDPNLSPPSSVQSWATWQPDPNLAPTPPSLEPILLVPDPGSPGLFGPRSPRDDPYSDTLPKSSSPGILGRSELFKVDADDSMTSFVNDEVPTVPPIPLPSAADVLLSPLIDDVDMPSVTPPGSPPAVVQRKRQHNVAFGDNEDPEEELARRGRPRLREVSSPGETKLQKCEGDEQ